MLARHRPLHVAEPSAAPRSAYHYLPRTSGQPAATIIVVCTGNMCRSPMAERLLRTMLDEALGESAAAVRVASAGTHAMPGGQMAPHAERVLRELCADETGFVATRLTAEMVEQADLVLCATREHRSAAIMLCPRALRKTFTLREFGRLSAHVEAEHLAHLPLTAQIGAAAAEAARLRSYHPPDKPGHDDLGDPVGRAVGAFRDCAKMIRANLKAVMELLADARTQAQQATRSPTEPQAVEADTGVVDTQVVDAEPTEVIKRSSAGDTGADGRHRRAR